MQRSKAVSVEVKQVVGALCRLLAATGLEAVPTPEAFRRAKFSGGAEVEDQFWRLLASILQTADTVSCDACVQLGGDHRKVVAAGLWQTGYHADWVRGMEGGGVSSRDLLLALGWLLATGTLEKLLKQRVQQLDKTLLTPPPVNSQLPNELQLDSASLRKLQWLIGSLRYQGRILLSMQEERARLLHAVFSASPPSFVSSDQSSAVLRENYVCMQQLCDLLESYLNWKKVETVFWTWMDSVVDGHLSGPAVASRQQDPHAPSGSRRVGDCRKRGLENMEDMLMRLPTGQRGRRRGGGEADRGGGGQTSQAGSNASSLPLLSRLPSLSSTPQVYRPRLQTERPVKHSGPPAQWPCGEADAPDKLQAFQAVRLLLHTEALLLERRDGQRLASRVQLQEAVGRLDDLVLIPP